MGTAYAGFQRQMGKATVQGLLESAIKTVAQEQVTVSGSGRTDAGAHACRQVIAFSTASSLPPETIARAMNAYLPRDVVVTDLREVRTEFHPRFSAVSRLYRYLIYNRHERSPFWHARAAHIREYLDVDSMGRAALSLVGRHDVGSFVPASVRGDRVRTITRVSCRRVDHLISIDLEANGFMRQMARSMVGTLVDVGLGKTRVDGVAAIVEHADRRLAGQTMPAHGLYLVDVRYPNTGPFGGRESKQFDNNEWFKEYE